MAKRKPTGSPQSTSSSPLRPKPKRQCSAEPSQSSFKKLSCETAMLQLQSAFDKLQVHYDDGLLDGFKYVNLERDLAERFRDKRIEVDAWTVPEYVWILSNNENAKLEDRWTVCEADEDAVPPEYKKKWMEGADKTKAKEINLVLSVLRKLSETMAGHLDSNTLSWTWHGLNTGEERTLSHSGEGDGKKGEKAKEAAKNKKSNYDEDEEDAGDPDYMYYANTLRDRSVDLAHAMVSGFVQKMTNGKGRRFLRRCLDMATLIVGGPAQLQSKSFTVMETGTATSISEGFRVSKVQKPVPCGTPELIDVPKELPVPCGSPEFRQPSLPGEIPGTPITRRSSAPALGSTGKRPGSRPGSRPSSRASSHGSISDDIDNETNDATSVAPSSVANKGFIFPDCSVVSRDKSNFARYLLIAEIKSTNGPLPIRDRAQLYREMLGGGIHQTEIFGILINYVQAYIMRMQMDKENKVIKFSEKKYTFTPPKGSSFNHEVFGKFFRNMMAVLHYGNSNISELKMSE